MANISEKAISILAGNLNLGRSYVITIVFMSITICILIFPKSFHDMHSSFVFRSSRFQYPKFSYVFLEKPMSSYSGRAGRRNNNIPENRYYSKAQAGISISLVDEDLLLPLLPCSAQVRFRLNSKWIIGNSCFRNTALNCKIYISLEFTCRHRKL